MLALTSKWFYRLVMDESIWKFACLRDLRVPEPKQKQVSRKWISLYASAFGREQNLFFPTCPFDHRVQLVNSPHFFSPLQDGSHSYMFRQQEKHIGEKILSVGFVSDMSHLKMRPGEKRITA